MFLADGLEPAVVLRRRYDDATFALHRLRHEAGDLVGLELVVEAASQELGALHSAGGVPEIERAPVAVGVRDAIDQRGQGPEVLLVRDDLRGEAHG